METASHQTQLQACCHLLSASALASSAAVAVAVAVATGLPFPFTGLPSDFTRLAAFAYFPLLLLADSTTVSFYVLPTSLLGSNAVVPEHIMTRARTRRIC